MLLISYTVPRSSIAVPKSKTYPAFLVLVVLDCTGRARFCSRFRTRLYCARADKRLISHQIVLGAVDKQLISHLGVDEFRFLLGRQRGSDLHHTLSQYRSSWPYAIPVPSHTLSQYHSSWPYAVPVPSHTLSQYHSSWPYAVPVPSHTLSQYRSSEPHAIPVPLIASPTLSQYRSSSSRTPAAIRYLSTAHRGHTVCEYRDSYLSAAHSSYMHYLSTAHRSRTLSQYRTSRSTFVGSWLSLYRCIAYKIGAVGQCGGEEEEGREEGER
eukprot:1233631-Rhodomonas_salina.2